MDFNSHRFFTAIVCILCLGVLGCSGDEEAEDPGYTITLTFLDESTEDPINGVQLQFERCVNLEAQTNNCLEFEFPLSLTTGSDGVAQFNSTVEFDAINVTATGYLSIKLRLTGITETTNSTEVLLTPN